MHGSGGFSLDGFLDVKGVDVQFYFMYRNVLEAWSCMHVQARMHALAHANMHTHARAHMRKARTRRKHTRTQEGACVPACVQRKDCAEHLGREQLD